METITAEQPQKIEKYKSFDVLASVDLYRFDLQTVGCIRPETRQRAYDEELSYIAEGINRPLDTIFTLRKVDGELAIFHEGHWLPYQSTLLKGWQIAESEAKADPRKNFLAERAAKDFIIGQQFSSLQPEKKLAWYSPFPEQEYQQYGKEFINSLGFQSDRKLGFIYTATKNTDGSLTLRSRSVDNSDEDAFVAAIDKVNEPEADMDDGLGAYDDTMARKFGGQFHAGRRGHVPEENAWNLIERHQDLLQFYFNKLEALASQNYSRGDLEVAKKRLTYGVWAALKQRLDGQAQPAIATAQQPFGYSPNMYTEQHSLSQEVERAYKTLSKRGEVLPGCGGSISAESDLLNTSTESVFSSIFGGGEDKYGSLTFKCPKGHTNRRPRDKLIPNCQKCGVSVRC